MDEFEELYCISDLHLGGEAPYQAFRETKALAGLVRHVAERALTKRVGLVLNGDIVDFLAEPNAEEFTLNPERSLTRIFGDATFKDVFDALERFTAIDKATLVVAIGNHDIELALPSGRRALSSYIAPT